MTNAREFKLELFIASIIASLEKNPARNGVPVNARLPIVKQEVVVGNRFCNPPILRISCSSLKLWIIEPEHKNNIALKNAWVQMWKNASCGWFNPIVTIINPNWLEVENATIFLMSFWVSAQAAVNSVVRAPMERHRDSAVWLFSNKGWNRISKKIPATTIVLECNSADTGVGPSMAAGNHGWSPNCADLPIAARIRPSRGSIELSYNKKICWISQEFVSITNQAMLTIKPMSPTRLYTTACIAAVFASARANHQPISRNDIIPTPSQPMNSWNMLFAVTRIIIAIKKINRYLKNRLMSLSECIYHIANSRIDQVTNMAIGKNRMDIWSNLKLKHTSVLKINIHWKEVTIDSIPLAI